jgi:hypothetical protein
MKTTKVTKTAHIFDLSYHPYKAHTYKAHKFKAHIF